MTDDTALLELLYQVPVGILLFADDGAISLANPLAAQLLLPHAPDGRFDNVFPLMGIEAEEIRARLAAFGDRIGTVVESHRLAWPSHPAGPPRLVLSMTLSRMGPDRNIAAFQDVTQLAESERERLRQARRLAAIFDTVQDYAIYTINLNGDIDGWNASGERVFGWHRRDVIGKSLDVVLPPIEREFASLQMLLGRASAAGWVHLEGWAGRRQGGRFWAETTVSVIRDDEEVIVGYSVITRDHTDRKSQEDELRRLATTDPLTGAYNRRHFMQLATAELERWRRYGSAFALILLDIDHFKRLNDQHGHDAGDRALIATVSAVNDTLRTVDLLARFGGEEFVLLLPETEASGAERAAERIRMAVASLKQIDAATGASISWTVSQGIALSSRNDETVDAMLKRADTALYAAKKNGRDRVVLAPG